MATKSKTPRHVGLIVDGNRRWSVLNGLPTLSGHKKGLETIRLLGKELMKRDVAYVTAYIFSIENWSRDTKEVNYLMDLAHDRFTKDIDDFMENDIRLLVLGRRDGVPEKVLKVMDAAVERTKNNSSGTLSLCFNYGGRQEIVDAVGRALEKGEEITESSIQENLYAGLDVPDVDIIVRTSGEQRISNFMLWRSSYSEMLFIDKHFPDIDPVEDAKRIIESYAERSRRFGGNGR